MARRPPDTDDDRRDRVLDDGTLLKPIAVDTTVADGSDLIETYKVKAGDTLTGIATQVRRLDDDPVVGQRPQVEGRPPHRPDAHGSRRSPALVVTVSPTDTLDALAARYKVDEPRTSSTPTGSTTRTSSSARSLVLPGAKGAGIPTPKPTPRSPSRSRSGSSGSGSRSEHRGRRPSTHGGKFPWPVVGGGNYISQYFHYGHYAHRHRRRLRHAGRAAAGRDGDLRRLEEQRRRLPGLDRPRLRACTRRTTTCRRSRSGAASTSGAASRSAGSARPATRPVRTSTSRSGGPRLGRRHARQPARLPLGRVLASAARPADRGAGRTVREWPRCSSTA